MSLKQFLTHRTISLESTMKTVCGFYLLVPRMMMALSLIMFDGKVVCQQARETIVDVFNHQWKELISVLVGCAGII
ncbi:2050_t:CDS:2 [Paraglomus occultum]|uniref:2050_t:CDS:1 n=1 Tax=Paraglomus occultum TaxID=144539 RepID=A0A9N8W4Z3_9GLOM|nr:2050_t:CDS:2 [Paraglomus occultum]